MTALAWYDKNDPALAERFRARLARNLQLEAAGLPFEAIAYYNEFDPKAAAWLRELIKHNLIAFGVVDERSISDVRPIELAGFCQCHFFAGIGGWSRALRLAGVPDTARVWTGSCPCQPFSQSGAGLGFDDERHLWPDFHYLIDQCRPRVVYGEQVASPDGLAWVDYVQADMEGSDYAFNANDLCAAGFGAPHIRQRLFFVGHANGARLQGYAGYDGAAGWERSQRSIAEASVSLRLADGARGGLGEGCPPDAGHGGARHGSGLDGSDGGLADGDSLRQQSVPGAGLCADAEPHAEPRSDPGKLADTVGVLSAEPAWEWDRPGEAEVAGAPSLHPGCSAVSDPRPAGPTNGAWAATDWLFSRDGKWRPVESGTFPLADGLPARVVLLRGYGNAIVPSVAAGFIKASIEAITESQS